MANSPVTIPQVAGATQRSLVPLVPGEDMKKGAMLVQGDRAQAYVQMDDRDEQMIRNELAGSFSDEFVYDLPFKSNKPGACTCDAYKDRDGKVVPHEHARDLSISGVREATRLLGYIQGKVSPPQLVKENGKEYYMCECTAVDLKNGNSQNRFYRQSLNKETRGGFVQEDRFAFDIAQSKAEREAKKALLPQGYKKAFIEAYCAKGNVAAIAEAFRAKELPAGVDHALSAGSGLPDEGGDEEITSPAGLISRKQVFYATGLFKKAKIENGDVARVLKAEFGCEILSRLSKAQATVLIDKLKSGKMKPPEPEPEKESDE
jgi:hypothetical protein